MVHATVRSLADHLRDSSVTFVPIRDLPPSQTALVWLATNDSSRIEAFANAAAEVLARTELAAYQPHPPAIRAPLETSRAPRGSASLDAA
jgi:hypothetical protein